LIFFSKRSFLLRKSKIGLSGYRRLQAMSKRLSDSFSLLGLGLGLGLGLVLGLGSKLGLGLGLGWGWGVR
jgi:hypothetical protein